MDEILDGLYLSGIEAACKGAELSKAGVTHILTLDTRPLSKAVHAGFSFKYKFVHISDLASSDMLISIEECLKFVEEGRQSGKVLVHCYVGQSRSATVVIAYVMHKLNMTLEAAMALVTKIRPLVKPNDGFLSQLELFQNMGNKIDPKNPEYKLYQLNLLALRMQTDQIKNSLPEGSLSSDPLTAAETSGMVYKCKKCRRPLFCNSEVVGHIRGCGEAAFDWRGKKKVGVAQQAEDQCTQSLFIGPVQWMSQVIMCLSGKLNCPKCQSKIGSFNWAGEPCPCGTWMTPAFHIQRNKVDECRTNLLKMRARTSENNPMLTEPNAPSTELNT